MASPRLLGAILIVSLAGCAGATSDPAGDQEPCDTDGDCIDGFLCRDDVCSKSCNDDRDCPSGDQACTDGACEFVPNATCKTDDDCGNPAACFFAGGG